MRPAAAPVRVAAVVEGVAVAPPGPEGAVEVLRRPLGAVALPAVLA